MICRTAHSACVLLLMLWVAGCNRDSATTSTGQAAPPSERFLSLMNSGKNYLDQGDSTNALSVYSDAAAIAPNDVDLRLNMANAHLVAGDSQAAIRESAEALKLDPNLAAAWFIAGSAHLRMSNWEEAAKAFENAQKIDPGETATFFQMGRARMGLQQWDAAITAFREGIRTDPNRLHTAAHYLLAQSLIRAGRTAEAEKQLELHQTNLGAGGAPVSEVTFERSRYTQARVPFRLDQPEAKGIAVRFTDATGEVFGEDAARFSGPLGVIDPSRSGWNSLFVTERGLGLRMFWNSNGVFRPDRTNVAAVPGAVYSTMLVGDLQNDRADDVVVLGDKGSHVFSFQTNGLVQAAPARGQLSEFSGSDGIVMDVDFMGKLDLIGTGSAGGELQMFRQFGALQFSNVTASSGIPDSLRAVQGISMTDWNRDGNMDLVVSRQSDRPLLLEKQRGGRMLPREITNWVSGSVVCAADFDNDLRPDLAIVNGTKVTICFNGGNRLEFAAADGAGIRSLIAFDHDNDGWLDLWAVGDRIRAWRNAGLAGFQDRSVQLGLDRLSAGSVSEIHLADFDRDCDTDVVAALVSGGLRFLRNDGGNDNLQAKVRLVGNRSNASGIGCKIEIVSGGLRLIRTVEQLPVEIGVGKHQRLDSFLVHWFNWPQGTAQASVDCNEPLLALELTIQEGSCPYLYAWNGERFEFVTDILGAAPLGLPLAEGRYIEADPEEYVRIGDEKAFLPKGDSYQLQITEELREALYLDEAKLVVVDHEPGKEVHPTDKLLPGGPFPPGRIATLQNEQRLRRAETLTGQDVTQALLAVDGIRFSPPSLRAPQLRGLAEMHGLILDFGPLDVGRPLVLVLNGWLRFGGGMANIAASHDASLPFPFPILEAEVLPGKWEKVDVTVGAPAGKTKTILVELENKLASGTRRLRLTTAFEIHWDRIALMEMDSGAQTTISLVRAARADLRYRGFSVLKDLPPDWPLTPDYDKVSPASFWTIIPQGWCTRYGDVRELLAQRDEGLLVMNAGDELTLDFPTRDLPQKSPGKVREFFLYVDGWDKDSDFHVGTGTRVEPLPFHGMNAQRYGSEPRPEFPSDALHRRFNTRWVDGGALRQTVRR